MEVLSRHADAARWAFNHVLAIMMASHRQWRHIVDLITHETALALLTRLGRLVRGTVQDAH
ncbi:hypothetical protein [Streptomyces malaysiensis]|uniref:hypothetical protein n=1 Tax=Streptomyces malaysiensis TaxID=92644 RepID=UPI0011CE7173|nr:hypothetical protein [Streptomyces malaysiensis]